MAPKRALTAEDIDGVKRSPGFIAEIFAVKMQQNAFLQSTEKVKNPERRKEPASTPPGQQKGGAKFQIQLKFKSRRTVRTWRTKLRDICLTEPTLTLKGFR